MFQIGAFPLRFADTSETFSEAMFYPKGLTDILGARQSTNFKADNQQYINIIRGISKNKRVFVVDENADYDFRNDSIRLQREFLWFSDKDLIMVNFMSMKGKEVVLDTTWIKIGLVGKKLYFSRNEHVSGMMEVDKKEFVVGVSDPLAGDFTYGSSSRIAVLREGKMVKDTLSESDKIALGEYLAFGENYFRFENISKSGDQVILIKEDHFHEKVGTQVGMIAPDFTGVTTEGDAIHSVDLQDKPILIINTCSCGGDKESLKMFHEAYQEYNDDLYVLGLDSKYPDSVSGQCFDVEREENKELYSHYRKQYCSRMCYLVQNKRIVAKFNIANWKSANIKNILESEI